MSIRERRHLLMGHRQNAYWESVSVWHLPGHARKNPRRIWSPVKHALRAKSMHSRYKFFFDYGDAEHFRQEIEKVRRSFEDVTEEPESNDDPKSRQSPSK